MRPFRSENVISEHINKPILKAYHVGFDQGEFRLEPLVDVIRSALPEYALGFHEGKDIPLTELVDRLKEAALSVFTSDSYLRRGEFGELILHLLLRDFHGTIPLISKIWFKDSNNVPVHGFDGVQITVDGDNKKLWLGESKLYSSGKDGVESLIGDVIKHVNADYLRSEFSLLKRKIPHDAPHIEHWRSLMDKHQKLDVIFSSIVIPMVCTYSSDVVRRHSEETEEYFADFVNECESLERMFVNGVPESKVEILLFLLPVSDKDALNTELFKRLRAMQGI